MFIKCITNTYNFNCVGYFR